MLKGSECTRCTGEGPTPGCQSFLGPWRGCQPVISSGLRASAAPLSAAPGLEPAFGKPATEIGQSTEPDFLLLLLGALCGFCIFLFVSTYPVCPRGSPRPLLLRKKATSLSDLAAAPGAQE